MLISEKGIVARREGKGNPLARGLSTELPFVVTMETSIIGTKQRHVAWQRRSPRFITHTLNTYISGNPQGGRECHFWGSWAIPVVTSPR